MRKAFAFGETRDNADGMTSGRINSRRLGLSLAVIGAIVVPVWTGSFSLSSFRLWTHSFEDDHDRYLESRGINRYSCIISPSAEVEACKAARALAGQNVIESNNFAPESLVKLIRDLLLGFLVPLVIVLIAPRIAGGYWRWLTRFPD